MFGDGVKIHLGCGAVFLKGYVNIDAVGHLAKDRPDLVEKLITTEDSYYARHSEKSIDTFRAGTLDQETVCDAHGSFENIPAAYWSASEVLARNAFEHLSLSEAHRALDQIDGIMEPNGILRLDVPDHEASLALYKETGDSFYVRHLLGPRRNEYGYHLVGYTRDSLRALVEAHGFLFVAEEPNIHEYPAMCLRFVKPGPRTPREYACPEIDPSWHVLDVGPGQFPLERANIYLDRDVENAVRLREQGKQVLVGNLMDGLPEIETGTFGFCWISHCLEHVSDVQKCVDTLNRIAKRGRAVMPSAIKEGLFGGQEESDHKWLILPSPVDGGPPVFVRHNSEYMRRIKDAEVEKITSRQWRTGPNRLHEARHLRRYFYEHEKDLDVIVDWSPEKPLRVIVVQ